MPNAIQNFDILPSDVALLAESLLEEVPTIYALREFVEAGGLMSYGASFSDAHRIAGTYVGRIPKGEKPADLPVQRSARIEMVFNLKTAKALDVEFPPKILAIVIQGYAAIAYTAQVQDHVSPLPSRPDRPGLARLMLVAPSQRGGGALGQDRGRDEETVSVEQRN